MTLEKLPADCDAADIVEANERDGGCIVERWLDGELLARFNSQLEPWLATHPGTNSGSQTSDEFLGHKTRRLQGLCKKTPAYAEILTDERLVSFAETVLAPVSPTIIMNNGEVIDIEPGESSQPLHRDDDAWNFVNQSHPLMINTIAALVDITADMGATLVVPGSHKWQKDRMPEASEILPCELKAGDALFFRGDTIHAGGANRSGKNRRALSTGLCCGWLRPVENSYTNIPLDVIRTLPRKAQALLGYALYDASGIGGGYLGYHDLGDPMKLMDQD